MIKVEFQITCSTAPFMTVQQHWTKQALQEFTTEQRGKIAISQPRKDQYIIECSYSTFSEILNKYR